MAALQRPAIVAPPRVFGRPRGGRLLLAAAVGLVIVAAGFQVNQFSRLTSTGYAINDLQRQHAERLAENRAIEAEVAGLSSLARVSWEAQTRLHLVPAQRKLYLTVNHTVPDRQSLPTRFLPPEPAMPGQAGEPMWKRLIKSLPSF